MGIAYKNICYPDATEACNAFLASFPIVGESSVTAVSSANCDNSGLVFFSGSRRDLATGQTTFFPAQSLQLTSCDSEFLSSYPVQDIFFVVALVFVWAIGFQSGMHR